jgi:hypothetical protein
MPPVVGPVAGARLVTVGGEFTYPKVCAAARLGWPATVITTALPVPDPAGVTHLAEVWLVHVLVVHATPPTVMARPPEPVPKFEPVSVRVVPPVGGPVVGDTLVIAGGR